MQFSLRLSPLFLLGLPLSWQVSYSPKAWVLHDGLDRPLSKPKKSANCGMKVPFLPPPDTAAKSLVVNPPRWRMGHRPRALSNSVTTRGTFFPRSSKEPSFTQPLGFPPQKRFLWCSIRQTAEVFFPSTPGPRTLFLYSPRLVTSCPFPPRQLQSPCNDTPPATRFGSSFPPPPVKQVTSFWVS